MRRYFLLIGLTILTLWMVVTLNTTRGTDRLTTRIDRLYIFGDSLSDTGNVYRATGKSSPPDPPYFQGRYSNGRIWVDFLAEKLGIKPDRVRNFAWGGATTGNDERVPSLLSQVQEFSHAERSIDPRALALVWIGGNDYLRDTATATVPLANLSTALTSLSRLGVRQFLVVNLPDFGRFPIGLSQSKALNSVVKAHNQGLSAIIIKISRQFPDKVKFIEFSAYSLYGEAIDHPDRFGFEDTRSACFHEKSSCKHPDRFLFWDMVHPTTIAHRLMAERVYRLIEKAF